MSRNAPLWICAAALACSAVPAGAQCRLCDTPNVGGEISAPGEPIRLEIETSLSFDRLIMFGADGGSAQLLPDGSRTSAGAITGVGPRAMVGKAVIHGEAGRTVRVDLPRRIELHSLGGGTISVDELTSDLPAIPRLDGSGKLAFSFGGRVRIRGDADGDYRGTLPITADYQ
jgi:hypothetical protein